RKLAGKVCLIDFAAFSHGCHLETGAGLLADELPGHDIGMMLKISYQYFVAGFERAARVTLCYQVNRFGSAAGKNNFLAAGGIDESAHGLPRTFISSGGLLAQGMHAAVDIAVVIAVIGGQCFDNTSRFLGRRSVIKVNQWLAMMHGARQDGEIPP